MKTALKDKYYGLRLLTLQKLNLVNDSVRKSIQPILMEMAQNDPKILVRAGAIAALGKYRDDSFKPLFLKSVNDSSYAVAGKSLLALVPIDTLTALEYAKKTIRRILREHYRMLSQLCCLPVQERRISILLQNVLRMLPFGNEKFAILQPFADYLKRTSNPDNFKQGIDMIVTFRDTVPEQYRQMLTPYFNGMILNSIAGANSQRHD